MACKFIMFYYALILHIFEFLNFDSGPRHYAMCIRKDGEAGGEKTVYAQPNNFGEFLLYSSAAFFRN